MEIILQAAGLVFAPQVLMVIVLSGAFGMFMGAIPGLSATMATALLVPVTFFMPPVPALAAIVTATAMAIFAGDLPGALLRIPGTPASAAYTDEAYAMTRKGKAELVLGVGLSSAVVGGLFGAFVLTFTAPMLAEFALKFSSFEYFWLACLGLTSAAFISTDEPVKGLISLLIGLLIATVGIDPTAGHPRFTFGSVELMGGVNFIPAMIGMFAVAEVLRSVTSTAVPVKVQFGHFGNVFHGVGGVLLRYKKNLLRGSVIGTLVGALPGAGSDIAAWISYAVSKKFSREPEKYGTGHVEGIVDAGASNNAGLGGTWVPALVFGIPGDSITAIVIGVLYVKGMNPGPTVFLEQPELIYSVFVTFFLANLLLLPLGFLAIKSSTQLLRVPRNVLMPIILMFCVVGTFAINNTVFGVGIMLVLGLVAYVLEENGFPIAPAILGLVLGGLLERSFMTSMIKADGNLIAFFERPIAAVLGIITIMIWVSPLFLRLRRKGASPAGDV
ncbi:tripartite tricarboxylate transporter permease [Aliiruegeria sabulilitoris]|uniref:tripartite tricarboxylate transporter permease n=1 Tax=Aliiruegeria sabulilitoris TaxID=1510458 RepID=UPI000830900F|nr:tripartite tricarboxylate transporter permease [Aliiruegeria sabulilitoris]NDR58469.1 tripartite tricarboxylate transporter permease [Pseudoruegeria sp. M32A2M]